MTQAIRTVAFATQVLFASSVALLTQASRGSVSCSS